MYTISSPLVYLLISYTIDYLYFPHFFIMVDRLICSEYQNVLIISSMSLWLFFFSWIISSNVSDDEFSINWICQQNWLQKYNWRIMLNTRVHPPNQGSTVSLTPLFHSFTILEVKLSLLHNVCQHTCHSNRIMTSLLYYTGREIPFFKPKLVCQTICVLLVIVPTLKQPMSLMTSFTVYFFVLPVVKGAILL